MLLPMRDPALDRAFSIIGGAQKVADILGITVQATFQWTKCPAERVLAVSDATGGLVPPHELRPDLYRAPGALGGDLPPQPQEVYAASSTSKNPASPVNTGAAPPTIKVAV